MELFPYQNKQGDLNSNGKDASIKHAPNDIILWADPENISCEGPDKKLAKGQGGKLIKVKLEINL